MFRFQPVTRILNRLSLKFKLFVLLILISIIPITLVSYSSEYFMYRSGTEYSATISEQYVDFVSREMSGYLDSLNQSFDSVFMNPSFQSFMTTPADQLDMQATHMMRIRPIVRNTLQFHPEVAGILYLDRLDKHYFDSYQKQLDLAFDFSTKPYYQDILTLDRPELTGPRTLDYIAYSETNVFSYVRPIFHTLTGTTQAVFIMEIHEDKLRSMLSEGDQDQQGQVMLLHEPSGTIVSDLPQAKALVDDFRAARDEHSQQSIVVFTSDNTQYQASYASLTNSDWSIIWTSPLSSIREGVQQTYRLTLVIAALSLAAALIIAFPVMNVILYPLYRLKESMLKMGRGKRQYIQVELGHNYDEIGFLIHSYNRMIQRLEWMESEVYQANMREKERELLQLQAQINPHFLFNTLETIESYAVSNKGEAVGEMVQSVSQMMRYTVRNDDGFATLQEELDYIRNFLTIHFYRNGKAVHADLQIDSSVLDLSVMKLSIQPFVENAIKYGWGPHLGPDDFTLRVDVMRSDTYLHVRIYNSGSSIPSHVLSKLHSLIAKRGETQDSYFRKHTGIYNTYRRFVLMYGEELVFHIESDSDTGTVFEFHLPFHQRKLSDTEQKG
ncbi:sensor histidine kinase [Paenibacillus daejeonensis]|uniref:sensor histidine kinase n=1 Tax=Paenibacillus daejeonensis TaxID=135193 RepID=UPI00036D1455|nr:sensor histidine kinase [Paenibacillus daejeonensis]